MLSRRPRVEASGRWHRASRLSDLSRDNEESAAVLPSMHCVSDTTQPPLRPVGGTVAMLCVCVCVYVMALGVCALSHPHVLIRGVTHS